MTDAAVQEQVGDWCLVGCGTALTCRAAAPPADCITKCPPAPGQPQLLSTLRPAALHGAGEGAPPPPLPRAPRLPPRPAPPATRAAVVRHVSPMRRVFLPSLPLSDSGPPHVCPPGGGCQPAGPRDERRRAGRWAQPAAGPRLRGSCLRSSPAARLPLLLVPGPAAGFRALPRACRVQLRGCSACHSHSTGAAAAAFRACPHPACRSCLFPLARAEVGAACMGLRYGESALAEQVC